MKSSTIYITPIHCAENNQNNLKFKDKHNRDVFVSSLSDISLNFTPHKEMLQWNRFRWYGDVLKTDATDPVNQCLEHQTMNGTIQNLDAGQI